VDRTPASTSRPQRDSSSPPPKDDPPDQREPAAQHEPRAARSEPPTRADCPGGQGQGSQGQTQQQPPDAGARSDVAFTGSSQPDQHDARPPRPVAEAR
jgi:hypothetical protein